MTALGASVCVTVSGPGARRPDDQMLYSASESRLLYDLLDARARHQVSDLEQAVCVVLGRAPHQLGLDDQKPEAEARGADDRGGHRPI